MRPLKIICTLASNLNGFPPHLDSMLELAAANQKGISQRHLVRKDLPLPEPVEIPLQFGEAGGFLVPKASSPIVPKCYETVEKISKKIDADNALLLRSDERKTITATSKGYMARRWLPRRIRVIKSIVWFCVGVQDEIEKLLLDIPSVGKEIGHGHGRVKQWLVEPFDNDFSWFAESDYGLVLMRPLPCDCVSVDYFEGIVNSSWKLPDNLVGYRRHFGAYRSPYWHPQRQTHIVTPC